MGRHKLIISAQQRHISSLAPEQREYIKNIAQKITQRMFTEQLSSSQTALEMLTARKISKASHNGDLIRDSYHNTLHKLDEYYLQGNLSGLIGNPEHKAYTFHQLREQTRLTSWESMAPGDVEHLRERNLELHNRAEGPTFERLIERKQKDNRNASLNEIYEMICSSGFGSTSKDYNKKYGFTPISIPVHIEHGVESTLQRKERLLNDEVITDTPKPT